MAWANSSNIDTTNLDSGTDSPAAARADIKAALDELVLVINGRGQANGVVPLDASSKILATYLPDTIQSGTGQDLTLNPDTGKVAIENIINLAPQTVAELEARNDISEGDVAVCSNGDAGALCLAVASGETDSAGNPVWRRLSLGSAISAT
jgi:hypothetical protein